MTTISTDGVTIAADGLACIGNEIVQWNCPKIVVRAGRIYAVTGSDALGRVAIDWHVAGADPSKLPVAGADASWSLIVIEGPTPIKTATRYTSAMPYPDVFPLPQAFGSGCEYAMGALLAGASPRESVEIAAKLNCHTGGEIQVVDIATALAGGVTSTIGHVSMAAE